MSHQKEQTAASEYGNRVGDFKFGLSGIVGLTRVVTDCLKPLGPSMRIQMGMISFSTRIGVVLSCTNLKIIERSSGGRSVINVFRTTIEHSVVLIVDSSRKYPPARLWYFFSRDL